MAAANTAFGFFPLLLSDVQWKEISHTKWSRYAMPVVRGLIIAVPLLLLFGALFMAADAIFEGLVRHTLRLDGEQLMTHTLLVVIFTWMSGGFLRGMVLGAGVKSAKDSQLLLTMLGITGSSSANQGDRKTGSGQTSAISIGEDVETACAKTGNENPRGFTSSSSVIVESIVNSNSDTPGSRAADNVDDSSAVTLGVDETKKDEATPRAKLLSLGIVEVGVALGLVNLLFLCFVVVQIRYLFGGAGAVVASTGMTYAEYARRGFFELVTVAALVLPLLLAMHWLLRKSNAAHERVFRILAGMQVALLFVIMTSALMRMRLYQSEYGLTELRLYTTAFMGWLGVVFIWFAATVLRGRRERFACGALIAGLMVAAGLHVLNPDAFIVRTNVAQIKTGRDFDAGYAASLSADAVPALVKAFPALSVHDRGVAAKVLLSRWSSQRSTDWRTWNWARSEARHILRENAPLLINLARAEAHEATTDISRHAVAEAK